MVSAGSRLRRASASAGASALVSALIRPDWAKGPWPPLKPLYNSQNQRTENEWQYQYRTCNNWREWNEYYSHQQKELTAYNNYMVQEQQKINTLPANEQNSHENQLKMENIRKTYAKMAKELIELTRKTTKTERLKTCLPNVRAAVTTPAIDSVKEQAAIEAAIQQMKIKNDIAKAKCAVIQTATDYKQYAIGAGITCGLAIGQQLDQVLDTGRLLTGLCGAVGAYLGHEVINTFNSIIQQHITIPESLLDKTNSQLVTSQMIEAQCKDRRVEAKAALDRQRLALAP